MIEVVNAKLTKGYEHWKSEFENEESRKVRSEADITIIGYGWSHKPSDFMLSMISNP